MLHQQRKKQEHIPPNFLSGFTLIELIMVILLLAVLSAVAIPNFIDFRTDAKNASVQGSVGALRSAISIATAAIALREDPTTRTPKYPTVIELQKNVFTASHPTLSGTAILDPANGIPKNPWTPSSMGPGFFSSIIPASDCITGWSASPELKETWLESYCSFGTSYSGGYGWAYAETSGKIWAGTAFNGGAKGIVPGNGYSQWLCSGIVRRSEDCY